MLRTIKTIARLNSIQEDDLKNFLIKNNFNLISFKDDFLVNPWTANEILIKFKDLQKKKNK